MTMCSNMVHYGITRGIYAGNCCLLFSSETRNFFFFPKHSRLVCVRVHTHIPVILWVGLHGCEMCTCALGERTNFKCLETK
jgi:hypothetical protein